MINSSQRKRKERGQTKKNRKNKERNCVSKCSFCVLLFLVFFFLPLGPISFLHVRTGSSQSQVKLVTRVLPLLLPHLHLPFSSPALRRTSPSIWHNGQEREKLPERCADACADGTLRKTIPARLCQSFARNKLCFPKDLQRPCSKVNACMHSTIPTFVCPAALGARPQQARSQG